MFKYLYESLCETTYGGAINLWNVAINPLPSNHFNNYMSLTYDYII